MINFPRRPSRPVTVATFLPQPSYSTSVTTTRLLFHVPSSFFLVTRNGKILRLLSRTCLEKWHGWRARAVHDRAGVQRHSERDGRERSSKREKICATVKKVRRGGEKARGFLLVTHYTHPSFSFSPSSSGSTPSSSINSITSNPTSNSGTPPTPSPSFGRGKTRRTVRRTVLRSVEGV